MLEGENRIWDMILKSILKSSTKHLTNNFEVKDKR